MRILHTAQVSDPDTLTGLDRHAFYNSMDCALTYEIMEAQQKELASDPVAASVYRFDFGKQCTALRMMERGVWIDPIARERLMLELAQKREHILHILDTYGKVLWPHTHVMKNSKTGATRQISFNPGSSDQKKELLYKCLQLPEQKRYDKETRGMRVTTDRAALEFLQSEHPRAAPLIYAILAYQDVNKAYSILQSGIEPNGRMRASFLVAGPITGRYASRKNVFNRGMNFQNVREAWRCIFHATPGSMPEEERSRFNIPDEFRDLPAVEDTP